MKKYRLTTLKHYKYEGPSSETCTMKIQNSIYLLKYNDNASVVKSSSTSLIPYKE